MRAAALLFVAALGACRSADVPPARGRACGGDVDCALDGSQVCRFPAANTRAVCVPANGRTPDWMPDPL
jgi:hypothetical protein